ncbi:PucR family transcriptional regulator [Chloroflexia bacterium SDU3-3]|nr:PucR family transcriptional regulator [Chloroflexia bacterium SDU3-3]
MQLTEALTFDSLRKASIVAGAPAIQREVRWVHVIDTPDPAAWVRPGMLLLSTGYAWPREEADLVALLRALEARGIAAIALAVPQFFTHFPTCMREEADRIGLPLIEIPWEIPFAQIAEELLQALVVQQYHQIQQSEVIHRALTSAAVEAESLQDIADALGRLIDRAVTIEDMEGSLLAAHRAPQIEDTVRLRTLEDGRTPSDYEHFLELGGYAGQLAAAYGPVRIPSAPDMGATGRVICPIRLKHETVGRIWIIEGARPLSELDLRAAEQAAFIAALHILHQRELETREARVGYAFLDSLLDGTFAHTPQTFERARLLGFDPSASYHVGLFQLHVELPLSAEAFQRRERLATRLRQRLARVGGPALLSLNGDQIPFLLPQGAPGEQIWAELAADDVSLTISRVRQGVAGIQQSYRDIQSLIPLIGAGSFVPAERLLLPRVLGGDQAAQADFLDELLGPLEQARSGQTLIATLVEFANHGFHLAQAAQALFIHPKTLRYRLERIAEISHLDLNDSDTRFRIQLAAQLLRLRPH